LSTVETAFRGAFAKAIRLQNDEGVVEGTGNHSLGEVSFLFTPRKDSLALASPEGVFHQDLLFSDEVAGLFALCEQSAARVSAIHIAALEQSEAERADPCLRDVLQSFFEVCACTQ
jgi:hypothetical protein